MGALFNLLRGRATLISKQSPVAISMPSEDAIEEGTPLSGHFDNVTGHLVIIDYRDAKGVDSTRRISCIRLNTANADRAYLMAWCHERRARRSFLVGRITEVIDATTGESCGSGPKYFSTFAADGHFSAGYHWGLCPVDYANIVAGLNVLTFMARCDGHAHESEHDEIDAFITSWWMRREFAHDIPEMEVAQKVRKLAPDAESFVMSLDRAAHEPLIRGLLYRYADRLIVADGRIDPKEAHWIKLVREQLAEN
jgi:hypothetical protein